MVTHSGTTQAAYGLSTVIEREQLLSTSFGRLRRKLVFIQHMTLAKTGAYTKGAFTAALNEVRDQVRYETDRAAGIKFHCSSYITL